MVRRIRAAVGPLLIAAPFLFPALALAQGGATPWPFDQLDVNGFPVGCYVDVPPEQISDVRQMSQCVYLWRVSVGSVPVMGAGGWAIEYGPGVKFRMQWEDLTALAVMAGMVTAAAFFVGIRLGGGGPSA